MAKKRDEISEEKAIQRANEVFGEEGIAKFQALSPDDKAALLRVISSPAPPPPKHAGGRKKGSGLDYTPYLRRMAELQIEEPELEDHPASRRVKEEFQALGVHLSSETLRTYYRPRKAALLAAIREERRPRPRRVVSVVVGSPGSATPPSYFGSASTIEAARSALLGPGIEDLKTVILGQSGAQLAAMYGPSIAELAAMAGPIVLPKTAAEMAEELFRGPGSLRDAEETFRRLSASSAEEAIRGLGILLGKKPPG